jgi:AcrR family transcriptional regulator
MPRSAEATKTKIFAAAYTLLFREGFSRTSMDAIAFAAGVTKKTLYYHFDSKDALVAALLEHQRARALAMFQEWSDPGASDPLAFVRSLFKKLEDWTNTSPWYGSGFTRLTMELADLPGHPARGAAHQHKLEVENWLAIQLRIRGHHQPTAVARQLMLVIEGCLALVLIHQDSSYVRSAADAARRILCPKSE